MARARLLLVIASLVLLPVQVRASEWGGIEPGVSLLEQVREHYGNPSKETRAKLEGYDTVQWTYEGNRAPAGLVRMTVDFGLLTPAGYKRFLVRLLKLEPKPLIFGRGTVVQGWGVPDGVATGQDGQAIFFYKEGLLVLFDKEGDSALTMIFSPPQAESAAGAPADPAAPSAPPASPRR